MRCEVHDGAHIVLTHDSVHQRLITGVSHDQLTMKNRAGKACREIVENHDLATDLSELAHHMTPDIAGTAGDKHCLAHGFETARRCLSIADPAVGTLSSVEHEDRDVRGAGAFREQLGQ